MNELDVDILQRGVRIEVNGRIATVINPHHPQWIDHKTRVFKRVFQGADVRFEDGQCAYVHARDICIKESGE